MGALLEGARDQETPGKVISNAPSVNQVNGTKRNEILPIFTYIISLDPYQLYLSVIKTLPLNSASAIGHLFLFCKTSPCHIYLKEGELQPLQNFLTGPYLIILICMFELIPPLYPAYSPSSRVPRIELSSARIPPSLSPLNACCAGFPSHK